MVYKTIDAANNAVIRKIVASSPVLLDVVPAKTVIKELNEGKVLLHAGPPIKWENMPDPMKGSCIGAVLFEEWADTEEEAKKILNAGKLHLFHVIMYRQLVLWVELLLLICRICCKKYNL